MFICSFLVFWCSFYLFFFLFLIVSWLLCSITDAHILLHKYCQQFSCVSGWVGLHDKRLGLVLRPSDTQLRGLSNHNIVIKTLRRASVLSSDRQGSWFPSALRSPERALAAGRTCYLLLRLLLVVVVAHWFGFFCRNLYGFNAVLLCNGRFWDGFTSATSAS